MNLTLNSKVSLVPLEIRKDTKNYIVEDKIYGEFYEMPKICIDALNLICDGLPLGKIQIKLTSKYPEEDVDILDFAEQLLDMKLIANIDGIPFEQKQKPKPKLKPINKLQGFTWITPQLGQFFFNNLSFFVYIALFVISVTLCIKKPALFPHYKDLFLTEYMTINIPVWLFLTFFLVLIHEFGHVLAMRAYNLPAKLEVGHRLFLVVLETDMSSVWKLPSKDRNILYFSGICFDTVILSGALITQLVLGDGAGISNSIMKMIVLDTFIRIVYQLCIYMKTDLYYVFENVSGCYNLMENAQHLISTKLPFVHKNINKDPFFAGERKIVILYSIFYSIGVVLTVALYFTFYIPQILFAWKKVLPGFTYEISSYAFWDAFAFSLQIIIGLALLLYSWRKKYVQR
ncbi:hypothetical protein [Bacillus sp. USDA818B3_A]|uniref:hypothetical protein n=1 Tax=Bacillus sp. USDA818B3_A TaxID=2698834 RepID=UPI00136AC63F|nr:hypothetical protein [Bacillus sp. USDA818B3_A]